MTILPRAMTAGELAKVRSDNQSSRLYLTVHTPATVYSARLAAVPSSNDRVASVTYNSGSGTHTNILADMTLYVGTSAGAYDVGMARIRNTTGIGATSGTFNLGLLSELNWPASAYLTVVDEFALWPRWPYVDDSGVVYMDYDVAYVNQHRYCNSFPVFPRVAVKWLTGATVNVVRDGSQSWALGNTINSYSWAAPGSSALSGGSTSVATITYNAKSPTAGYRVALTVNNTDSAPFTGYGRVFILQDESDAITEFTLDRLSGSFGNGGWSAQLTLYAQADRTTIRDRALVVLHRKDFYGISATDAGSLGPVADDENIEFIGWIDGETINWQSEDQPGSVSFTVQGPQYWLDKLTMPTVGIKNKSGHPTNWKRFWGLSAKSATWHLLMWRTTAPRMMDCFSIENGYASLQLQSGGAQTVWQQLSNILDDFLMGQPCCDAYARLFMQIEQQLLSLTDRSAIPTVMTLTTGDWENVVDFDRREVHDVAGVDVTGEIYDGVNEMTAVYALAPGRVFNSLGSSVLSRKGLAVDSQATLNALAGAWLGWKTNPYPRWRFELPSNNHFIDLAPYQYLGISVASGDTRRGVTLTNLRLIPRDIERQHVNGYWKTIVTTEAESTIALSVTGDTPADAPVIPVTPPPPPYVPPTPLPVPSGNAKELWIFSNSDMYWSGDFAGGGQPTFNKVAGPGGTMSWFGITPGGVAYAATATQLWKATTPKVPNWTSILALGDTVGSYQVAYRAFGWLMGPYTRVGSKVYATCSVNSPGEGIVYGEYDGSSWSWSAPITSLCFQPDSVGPQTEIIVYGSWYVYNMPSWAALEAVTAGTATSYQVYRSPAGKRVWARSVGSSNPVYVRIVGSDLANLGTQGFSGETQSTLVTGPEATGEQLYVVAHTVDKDGHLFVSEDGSTFTDVATWARGSVRDMTYNGGGSFVWVPLTVLQSNVPARLYGRNGSVIRDMTGNFWSLTSGTQNIKGFGLVY